MTPEVLAAGLLAGQVAAGARVIRWLEDADPRGREVLGKIIAHTGRAHVVGVTGPPGAGKSTLVDALIAALRARDRRVAAIAVDPSSPFTGGAILGDRVRMQRHAADPNVFIRSMGTRGRLGGLARATFDAMLVLDAMGYDPILVETVGVGQDEVDIASLAHSTVVVSVPGLGDEVQAIKAGVLEAGDVFVINKADRPDVPLLRRQLELMLHLRESGGRRSDWAPPLLDTVASSGQGIEALVETLQRHREHLAASVGMQERLGERCQSVFLAALRDGVVSRLLDGALRSPDTAGLLEDVRHQRLDPYTAAERLLARIAWPD
jgi:LAO/AO transport system kinase